MKPPRITLDALWLALPAALALILVGSTVEFPVDFWHNAATGRQIAAGTLPRCDTFTHTIAGQPIVNQAWLAQWAIYELVRLGSVALVQFAAAVCYAGAIAMVTAVTWFRCRNARVAAALALTTLALLASNLGVRTQAVSFALFAVEVFALWRWPDRWRTVLIVGVCELLWTNTHGAFPLGVVLPGLFLASAIVRREKKSVLAVCVAVAAVAAFCNPQPAQTLDYVFNVASRASPRGIEEWQSAPWSVMISAIAAVAIIVLGRRRPQAIELLLLVAFGVLALGSQRMIAWWAMVLAPALAPHVAAVVARWTSDSPHHSPLPKGEGTALNFVILVLLLAAVAFSTPWTRQWNPLLPACKRADHADDDPGAMIEFLARSPYRGRAFNPMEWGAYLTWHFDPAIKVFIDGRVDFFPDDVWDDYVRIGRAEPGWQASLDRRGVELVVWNRRWMSRLPTALKQSPRWKQVYEDDLAVVFVRRKNAGRE